MILNELARMASVFYPQPEKEAEPTAPEMAARESLTGPPPGHPERVPGHDEPLPRAEREFWQRLRDGRH